MRINLQNGSIVDSRKSKVENEKNCKKLNGVEAIKLVMEQTGTRQVDLAKSLKYRTQSAVSSKLKANKFDLSTFVKMMNTMGYAVIVKKGEEQIIISE